MWFTYIAHVHVSWMAKISYVEMRELNVVAVWRSVLSDIFHFYQMKYTTVGLRANSDILLKKGWGVRWTFWEKNGMLYL